MREKPTPSSPLGTGNPKSGSGRLPTSLHVRIWRIGCTGRIDVCVSAYFARWCEYGGRKGKHPLHKHNIDPMGHRWATKETQNETLVGVVAQSSRLKRSDDADKKQRMQSKKHKWNVLRLRRTSSSFDVFLYDMIKIPGPMGHRMCGAIPTQCEDCGAWWRIVACACKSEQVIEETPTQ